MGMVRPVQNLQSMLHSYGDPAFFAAFFCTNSTELVRVSVKFAASTMVKTEYSRNELHVFEAKCKRGSHVAFLPAWGKKKSARGKHDGIEFVFVFHFVCGNKFVLYQMRHTLHEQLLASRVSML